ncbi:Retrovirus-related Pol polyprotein from transposon TNT 1-94 [Cucumis melo var. makuwa]|uniref:Retrovirus-related Pol polyprotein from transposon TNT 1-94 n=1 Tax=Cucumis melo var. makuwa TaxID=1194695 RepID=A0A5D3CSA1_CUCMM|nr:Retrovirus-related Pol polyprotein from transposon TNT 1-94 [Cucumis melo var. makuwa]TYK14078.1 Retrovirus-related Pol polyprotein from transposon TNT 1-94 [Cucumis melo var. makuwa]
MDVKSTFLNGYLSEEVYVAQPKGFADPAHQDHVYKLRKALYGLKQAPRAWYERLTTYLLQQGYQGAVQIKLFYVEQFVAQMKGEFEMSMVGELTFFLRPKRTSAATHLKMTKDTNDWAGCTDDRKSTSGRCFFLGNNVTAWFNKKQNSVSLSTAEIEYIAAKSSCSQLLWMKQMLDEYGITQSSMILYCDNLSAIIISKNPVQHSRTKHIDIRHYFIRELVEANIIRLEHVQSSFQLADIFTKPLDVATFEGLRASVGVCQRPT